MSNIIKIIFFIFIILFIYLWQQIESENTLLKINSLKTDFEKEKKEYEQLQVIYNTLISPLRLDKISKDYGLYPPKKIQVLKYETD